MLQFLAFLKALPEVVNALRAAFNMWKQMQDNAFYRDSQKAFAKLEEAKTDDEIKSAVIALRDVYKRL